MKLKKTEAPVISRLKSWLWFKNHLCFLSNRDPQVPQELELEVQEPG